MYVLWLVRLRFLIWCSNLLVVVCVVYCYCKICPYFHLPGIILTRDEMQSESIGNCITKDNELRISGFLAGLVEMSNFVCLSWSASVR